MTRSHSILLLDLGNTRLKWQVITDHQIQASGHVAACSLDELGRQSSAIDDLGHCLANLGASVQVLGGSVGAPEVKAWFAQWLDQRHHHQVEWVVSRAHLAVELPQATVRLEQPYAQPERLGVDRWLAALGWLSLTAQQGAAPSLELESTRTSRLAMVSAGTATVVDGLVVNRRGADIRAQMMGGLIYPGFGLMRSGLADQTADLAAYVAAAPASSPGIGPAGDSVAAIHAGIAAAQVGPLCWLGPVDHVIVHGGYATDWLAAHVAWSAIPQSVASFQTQATEVQGLVFKGLSMLAEFA